MSIQFIIILLMLCFPPISMFNWMRKRFFFLRWAHFSCTADRPKVSGTKSICGPFSDCVSQMRNVWHVRWRKSDRHHLSYLVSNFCVLSGPLIELHRPIGEIDSERVGKNGHMWERKIELTVIYGQFPRRSLRSICIMNQTQLEISRREARERGKMHSRMQTQAKKISRLKLLFAERLLSSRRVPFTSIFKY